MVKIPKSEESEVHTKEASSTTEESTSLYDQMNTMLLQLESLNQRISAVEMRSGIGGEETLSSDKTVILNAPGYRNNEEDQLHMKADRYTEIQNQRKALVAAKSSRHPPVKNENVITLNQKLKTMVGSHLGLVQTSLTNMKVSGAISTFQVLPIGMPAPANHVGGRVIVTVDASSNVLDIYVG